MAINHGLKDRKQGRLPAALVLICLLGSFQPASAQNSMSGYGQQQGPYGQQQGSYGQQQGPYGQQQGPYGQPLIPVTSGSPQYQSVPGLMPGEPLTAGTQLNQQFGNAGQQPLMTAQQQQQTQSTSKRTKKKKEHHLLQKMENAAGAVGSGAVSTVGRAARVAAPAAMMLMMYRGMGYGSGYGSNPSYMYSYLPYMGAQMLRSY